MEALIDFAAVGGAIVLSLGIALSLEWLVLNTLMKMMPVQRPTMAADQIVSDVRGVGPELVASALVGRKRAA